MTEDLALEALLEFFNAVEAGIAAAKQRIREVKVETAENSDFNKLNWTTKEGTKGPFEQTSKSTNNNSTLFQALQRQLKEHGGFWKVGGFNFWFHKDDQDVVDRRKIRG